jgi:2-polyprenyl-3-methyl-5-hydroxy-6-metoxy-1,4-benzoquinol methylase
MKKCPYCKAHGNFYFRISSRTYNRCSGCDLIYKESQDSYDKVMAHYRDDYFTRNSADQMSGERDKLFGRILDLIEKSRDTGRLLDIGTGCGFFLVAAQKRGWKVKGIEPSIQSVEVAQRQYDLDVYNGTLQEYDENGEFSVITFINVLDHSVEPWKEVSKAKLLLKSNCVLFLRFPNGFLHSYLFKVSKKLNIDRIIARFLVFHEYCFTPGFVRRLLSDNGFADIEVYNASLSGESLIKSFPVFGFVTRAIEAVEKLTDLVSGGRVLWGPSLEVIARKE